MIRILLLVITLPLFGQPKADLQVHFQPGEPLYVYETVGMGSATLLYSALVQNVAIINTSNKPKVITSAQFIAYADGLPIQSKRVKPEVIREQALKLNRYEQMGILGLLEFQLQRGSYFKNDMTLAASDTLRPNQVLIIQHQAFLFDELPNRLELKITSQEGNAAPITTTKSIGVVNYQTKNDYLFPVSGQWLIGTAPSLEGHHRWAGVQEFAFDLIQLGNGTRSYQNEGNQLSDYYCYGAPVRVMADGEVVKVTENELEGTSMLKQPEESEGDYLQRIMVQQQLLLQKGMDAILGNHVIVSHGSGEYSTYAHLKPGSVSVNVGDKLKSGTVIGAIGNSGNSTEPHLHFHVSDSPEVTYSRSLPIRFKNIKLHPDDNGQITHLHSGQIVRSE